MSIVYALCVSLAMIVLDMSLMVPSVYRQHEHKALAGLDIFVV
jgi:hypothetical protein